MIQNKDMVVVKGDKDSSAVRIKRSDYVTKLDTMINQHVFIEQLKLTNLKL